MLGLLLILISKSWGCPPPGAGHAFPRQRHMRRRGGGNLFLAGFSSLYDAIHGWMTRRMDGKFHEKRPRRPLLYVISRLYQNRQIPTSPRETLEGVSGTLTPAPIKLKVGGGF
jgi:hypothetical protein